MIDLQHFVHGGYRDTHRVVIVSPSPQLPKAVPKPPSGWTQLQLDGFILYGAKRRHDDAESDTLVDSTKGMYKLDRPPLVNQHPYFKIWLTTDKGWITSMYACIYFTEFGFGDLILREMGLSYNHLDECKRGRAVELPVDGRKISHSLLLKKYKDAA